MFSLFMFDSFRSVYSKVSCQVPILEQPVSGKPQLFLGGYPTIIYEIS